MLYSGAWRSREPVRGSEATIPLHLTRAREGGSCCVGVGVSLGDHHRGGRVGDGERVSTIYSKCSFGSYNYVPGPVPGPVPVPVHTKLNPRNPCHISRGLWQRP